jgi:hypothetical protein
MPCSHCSASLGLSWLYQNCFQCQWPARNALSRRTLPNAFGSGGSDAGFDRWALAREPVMPNDSSPVAIHASPMGLIFVHVVARLLRECHRGGQQRLIDVHVSLEVAQQCHWQV